GARDVRDNWDGGGSAAVGCWWTARPLPLAAVALDAPRCRVQGLGYVEQVVDPVGHRPGRQRVGCRLKLINAVGKPSPAEDVRSVGEHLCGVGAGPCWLFVHDLDDLPELDEVLRGECAGLLELIRDLLQSPAGGENTCVSSLVKVSSSMGPSAASAGPFAPS